jgi:diguanylate cyclase (GGDEF)-like protein
VSRVARIPYLGAKVEQAVRAAPLSPGARELVRRTPGLSVAVQLGPDAERHVGLVELLKIATVEPDLVVTAQPAPDHSVVELSGPEGSTELPPRDLDQPLGPSFVEALADVTGWAHVAAVAFAVADEVGGLRHRVDELTRSDESTGLLNRRELEARLIQERSRVIRQRGALSVLLLEPDPEAEDAPPRSRHAHLPPEEARMRAAATVLKAELRAHDAAARLGPLELAVVLPGAGSLEVALVARRIGEAAARRGLSLSIGGASFPDDTDHPDDLLELAGKSLDRARTDGRGRAWMCGAEEPLVFDEEAGGSP